MPNKHEAVHSRWFDGCESNLNRISHKETDLIQRLDLKLIIVGSFALSEILIKLSLILEILKAVSVNLDVDLPHNHINLECNITVTIILTSENLSCDTQVIIDKGVWNDLKVSVGVAIKQVSFGLWFAFHSNNVETVFLEVRVVFMHDKTIRVVGLHFEGFIFNFRLWFLQ